jgi:hypothetical protein
LPLAIALALDIFAAMERIVACALAASIAGAFFGLAMLCWYRLAWLSKRKEQTMTDEGSKPTPLETQIDQLLTEARVTIPGVQALLRLPVNCHLHPGLCAARASWRRLGADNSN